MRPLDTDAEHADATALVQDRALWLARRDVTLPHRHTIAFRNTQGEALGLYEYDTSGDEVLVGCLILDRQPAGRPWAEDGPALSVSLVCTAPDRDDRVGHLITVWLADFAARTGATGVCAEAPGTCSRNDSAAHRLLDHLRDLGWLITGNGPNLDGEPVARLRLDPHRRKQLTHLVHCTVPVPKPLPPAPANEAAR
jgi:hypothetical protein